MLPSFSWVSREPNILGKLNNIAQIKSNFWFNNAKHFRFYYFLSVLAHFLGNQTNQELKFIAYQWKWKSGSLTRMEKLKNISQRKSNFRFNNAKHFRLYCFLSVLAHFLGNQTNQELKFITDQWKWKPGFLTQTSKVDKF